MRIRRFALVALLAAVLIPFARGAGPSAHGQQSQAVPYAVASESYFRVDTDNGRMSVRIHAEYQNMQAKDLASLPVYLLPGAENVVVKAGDVELTTKITPGDEAQGTAGMADATLPAPLKNNFRTTLEATYDVAPRTGGKHMTLEPGLVETVFIGQGPGSFVFVDVPTEGDSYFDPGCLEASKQPDDVKGAGLIRWVCGEVTIVALSADDPDVARRCANLDDSCRQRSEIAVFSAFAQSITDMSKAGRLEQDVAMPDGRTVKLTLKYFKKEQAWADRQFSVATQAFPKLEVLFGYSYPNEQITLRQSHHIGNGGAAGIAYSKLGEVLLATDTGFDDEVTVHELAHQWASRAKHFESSFMSEGLSEWAAQSLAAELGYQPLPQVWKLFPVNEPLLTWNNGSTLPFAEYWYGRSGAFWFAYEATVGGRETMSAILGRIDDEPSLWRLEAGWFMDQGEWVTNKDLDALFLDWVFQPVTAKARLETRRAAHTSVRELQARAATLGLDGMPSDIYDNLLAWVFDPVAGQVAKANKVLDSYAEVLQASSEAGLGAPDGVGKAWGKKRVSETLVVVEEQRQAIAAILSSAKELAGEPEDSVSMKKLAEARELYAAGDYAGAKAAAASGVTAAFNEVAAAKMIEIAREKQETFSPNFFGRIGMFWTDPEADLVAAEQALEAGDGTKALQLSQSAYESWEGATQRGIQRLALVAGIMCALTFGIWFILKRLDGPSAPTKRPGQGHYLEESTERRSSWRDWENSQ